MQQQLGMSYVELHYLLGVVETANGDRSRQRMGLFGFDDPEQLAAIGASVLLARGLIGLTEASDSIVPVNEGMFISYVLLNARRWTTIQSTDGAAKGDTGFFFESDLGSLMVQPRALDTWWFLLIDDVSASDNIITETVKGLVGQSEEMAIFLRTETLAADKSFTIHRDGAAWSHASGETGNPQPEELIEDTDQSATESALRTFLAAIEA
jgi:hypothetical protein